MTQRRILWLMIGVVLLAFAVRLVTLGDKSVWWDEAWSVWVAQQPFAQTTHLTASDVHPPLYQWALHIWVRLTGITEFAVRWLSLGWSLLTVPLVYAIGRRMGGTRAGLIAALFFAASAFTIHWAQETRMYAQASFFAALLTYAYLRVRATPERPRWWIVLVLAGAAVPLTHYLGAFMLVILNLHWLLTLRQQGRSFHLRWLAAMIATAALLLPWVLYAIGLTRSGSIPSDFDALLAFQLFATLMTAGTSVNLQQYAALTLVATVIYFALLALYARRRGSYALLVLLAAILPPLAIVALSLPETPFYAPKPEERYMIIFAPLVFTGVGLGLDALARRGPVGRLAAFAAGTSLLIVYGLAFARDLDERYIRDDYASMLGTAHLLAAPGEPLLFVSADRYPLVYYHLNRAANDDYSDIRAAGLNLPDGQMDPALVTQMLDGATRLWFVEIERHFQDPDDLSRAWFDERYPRVYAEDIDHNSLTLYALDDFTPPHSNATLPPVATEARPGDTVRVGASGLVIWRCGETIVYEDRRDGWRLSQFRVYPAYPNSDCTVEAGGKVYPFTITHSQPASPPAQVVLDLDFGDLTLLGYDLLRDTARRGEAFEIRLHWRVDEVPGQDWTVFAQLLGPFRDDGPVWVSADRYPAETPTTALWPGLVFTDTYTFAVPDDMPAGSHQAAFGLYELATGERLPLPSGADAIIIDGLQVID